MNSLSEPDGISRVTSNGAVEPAIAGRIRPTETLACGSLRISIFNRDEWRDHGFVIGAILFRAIVLGSGTAWIAQRL
jgi:hypothetical protein